MRNQYEVIKRPIISEKSTMLAEVANKYVFEVALSANKNEIRDAVQSLFNVKVKEVRTQVVHGKLKRRGQFLAKRQNWKKAIISLGEGQKIDFFGTN